ncbi:MAG: type II toxin-antitoxin system VapC family toxin [Dehalococcoidia bacterium]|nr:type II toxin-antitoxin system VapC family toxin [Dehalococcoidia bacterium]
MNEVFADAGFFIAILDDRDQYRETVRRALETFTGYRIVTTEMVLVEVFAALSRQGSQARAALVNHLHRLRNDPNVTIIPQTPEQFTSAAQLFAQRLDQRFSLTDCASFLVMKERGIRQALTFDTDFSVEGFTTTPA